MGTLADRVGARKVLLTGLCVFGLASAWAAFSTNPGSLIAARGALAVGGSMIMPTVLAIIRKTFEHDRERATALGLWGTVGAAGAAVGPLLGGALLAHFWWGSVFLINVPLMVVVVVACFFLLPRSEAATSGAWPIGHALILIVGMMTLVYGLKAGFGGTHDFFVIWSLVAVGLGLLVAFAMLQLRSAEPMLDLSLFARPAILAGVVLATVAAGSLAGVQLTLTQELQYVLGKTPLEAGAFLIPIVVAAGVGGPFASYFSNRFGLRRVASIALLVAAGSLGALAVTDFHDSGYLVPSLLAVLGLSLSVGLTASSIAIMGSVDASKGGAAGSLEATAYELGSGLGITVFGVFMSATFSAAIALPADLTEPQARQASQSIGDTFIVARELPERSGALLIEAGRAAFAHTHGILLSTAALALGLLSIVVFALLSKHRGGGSAH